MADNQNTSKAKSEGESKKRFDRRDFLKSLATVPVLGAFAYSVVKKVGADRSRKEELLSRLGLTKEAPAVLPKTTFRKKGELIRLGIIGYGGRGHALLRAAGFATPEWTSRDSENARRQIEAFLGQEDLNVVVTAVCDLFDVRAEEAIAASQNDVRPGGGSGGLKPAKRYRHYQDLLASNDVDAVIIATPDHWHARIIVDAAKAGKHVYSEKAMTRTEEEVYQVVDAVKRSGIVFQLGHQNRQQDSYKKAREIVARGILGPITLVQTTTNRNTPEGAWVYKIHEKASPETIDWEQFQEPAPHKVPFSKERFFRWRCWYDYGTGLAGDLLSHEYDAVNQILDLGIPHSAVASGGIYFYKDGRDVPDVFQVVYEYPDRDLTLIYSATLASAKGRPKMIMGHDATMIVGRDLVVDVDPFSTQFKKDIETGLIDTSLPLFSYQPGLKELDVVTSASQKYFASRGLMYTYRGGKLVDVTHLHMAEWLNCIRNGCQPSCNIDRGFEEAITCHMATRSYLEGRKVYWDPVKRRIV